MKTILLFPLLFSTQILSAQTFTETLQSPPIVGVEYGSIAFSDVNGDNFQDVLLAGSGSNGSTTITKLYINNGIESSTKESIIEKSLDIFLYPNPIKSNNLNVNYYSPKNGWVNLKLYDSKGRLMKLQKEFAVFGNQSFSIDIATLPQGNYFLQLDDGKKIGVTNFIVH